MSLRKLLQTVVTLIVIVAIVWGAVQLLSMDSNDVGDAAKETGNSAWDKFTNLFKDGASGWTEDFNRNRQLALPPTPNPTPSQ